MPATITILDALQNKLPKMHPGSRFPSIDLSDATPYNYATRNDCYATAQKSLADLLTLIKIKNQPLNAQQQRMSKCSQQSSTSTQQRLRRR